MRRRPLPRSASRRPRTDVAAGLTLLAVAGLAFWLTRDLRLGGLARMGPGFFPLILIGLLAVFGLAVLAKGLAIPGERMERWYPRPMIFVSLAVLVFGLLVEGAGLVPAAVAAVLTGSLASGASRPVEVALLAPAVAALVSAIFVLGLGLPIPILSL